MPNVESCSVILPWRGARQPFKEPQVINCNWLSWSHLSLAQESLMRLTGEKSTKMRHQLLRKPWQDMTKDLLVLHYYLYRKSLICGAIDLSLVWIRQTMPALETRMLPVATRELRMEEN